MNAKERLCQVAADLGFSACRIASVQEPPHGPFFERWLNDGCAAGMGYLERRRAERLSPASLLPGARSLVCLAAPYEPIALPPVDWRAELRGRVAAYAVGQDYHDTIRTRLDTLIHWMRAVAPGIECRGFVDSGPLLERDFAWLSGVGWFGKNTNLLCKQRGSWFFLAEILTTWELEPDPPTSAHCGSCTRCLSACPTGALANGFRLDARKCISYWTIEHRGPIPAQMRAALGPWVFGCDDCQDVCPWNEKFARGLPTTSRWQEAMPYLPELLALSEQEFRTRFRRSALWRARREGLARNAAVVLGNSGNPRAVPFLANALRLDPSPVVRSHAAWALGAIGSVSARDTLWQAKRRESHPQVLSEIAAALEGSPAPNHCVS